ncbi:MAG TPA: SDR family oxidoreductase [Lacipirellulaceae bacterium]|jgi:short-subunit dehydrogenase|nr:SDR family oxidoreductase [Lacipirellulaceae bacterium]
MPRTRAQNYGVAAAVAAASYVAAKAALAFSRRYNFRDRVVVITGGSRGLGLVLARKLADEGAFLVLCARDATELNDALQDLRRRTDFVEAYVCDLTQPAEIGRLFTRIRHEIGAVDVLINNAGLIQVGPVEAMTLDDFHNAMLTHFWAPLLCMWQVLPGMRRRGQGRIVNIASIGGEIGVPHLAPYCASKFALNGMSQTYGAELAKDGIYVTTVCPGLMRTGSARNALFKGRHRAEYAWFSIGDAMPLITMSAERAARQVLSACRYGRARVTLSLPAKAAVVMNAIAPDMTAELSRLVASVLPRFGGIGRNSAKGHNSESNWSPSMLTTLNERAAVRNNEVVPSCDGA